MVKIPLENRTIAQRDALSKKGRGAIVRTGTSGTKGASNRRVLPTIILFTLDGSKVAFVPPAVACGIEKSIAKVVLAV
jgi:hypothetical protein